MTKNKTTNSLAKTKITKVVLNMGLGESGKDKAYLEAAIADLMVITGQKPKVAKARISVAEFKLRKGDPNALVVTMRGKRMHDFLKKLITIVLPRFRDFRGIPLKSFDGHGNYNLGVAEQVVFPEIDSSKVDKVRGLQVTITTTAKTNEEGKILLEELGMPFEKHKE